jgi:protein-L-isoaspartate(D-aspartate) O-methyltransferase
MSSPDDSQRFERRRAEMVSEQLARRGIWHTGVLDVMRHVPRHEFVPESMQDLAYGDRALGVGYGQTISQPYIVALVTQLADPRPGDRALDVGTGTGYEAAVLSPLVEWVSSIEIVPELAESARERLERLGFDNVEVRCGDAFRGWAERAPFDVIVVAAACPSVPEALVEQLAPGGRLVLPVGEPHGEQQLVLVTKDAAGEVKSRAVASVAFVPMTGEAQERDE